MPLDAVRQRLDSPEEERVLADVVPATLEERKASADVDFDDPDVIDIETVHHATDMRNTPRPAAGFS